MSVKHDLYLCAYDRGQDLQNNTKPYHWSFFIQTHPTETRNGTVHQSHGMPDGFYYQGAEDVTDLQKTGPLLHQLEIGSIPKDKVNTVETLLQNINIVKDEASEWNCQDWFKSGFEILKARGWIWMEFDAVKNWVKEV